MLMWNVRIWSLWSTQKVEMYKTFAEQAVLNNFQDKRRSKHFFTQGIKSEALSFNDISDKWKKKIPKKLTRMAPESLQ